MNPFSQKTTKWTNPMNTKARLEFRVDGFGGKQDLVAIEILPGQTVEIPSVYDRVIHTVHNGVIVGGYGPQLVREGQTEVLSEALDETAKREKLAIEEMVKARIAQEAAEIAVERAVKKNAKKKAE